MKRTLSPSESLALTFASVPYGGGFRLHAMTQLFTMYEKKKYARHPRKRHAIGVENPLHWRPSAASFVRALSRIFRESRTPA
jgi:hypothetical protein